MEDAFSERVIMTKISRQEVLKIAYMSRIALREDEVNPLIAQLEQVLSYAERVTEAATSMQEPSTKQVNVFRDDLVVPQDPEPILAQAPEREGNYFVVPVILEN
jgi:aspartyl-tRNA(Asn)/glutamyl-tRNA(Gln) amidotransferase subunit C